MTSLMVNPVLLLPVGRPAVVSIGAAYAASQTVWLGAAGRVAMPSASTCRLVAHPPWMKSFAVGSGSVMDAGVNAELVGSVTAHRLAWCAVFFVAVVPLL